jgi:tRNA modification GTPase
LADSRDTIFALSSGTPPAAIAVVRISGPAAGTALRALAGRLPDARRALLAKIRNRAGEAIDQALVLWFPGPASETGEDVAELQLHGGRAVIAAVLRELAGFDGCRLAEPGEFTRRAFENGHIDLTQVEAIADLVDADTEAQRRQAVLQLEGLLGNRAETWRQRLIEAVALVEAGIDFPDEGDVPTSLLPEVARRVEGLASEISEAIAGAGRGERLRDGMWVVIAGPPNAGKSTLLNRLARRDAAIVSPTAGTTRDLIEVHLNLQGYPVNLIDTAGIREGAVDPIEHEGMRRARNAAARADLVLWLVDATNSSVVNDVQSAGNSVNDVQNVADALNDVQAVANEGSGRSPKRWVVLNKIDCLDETAQHRLEAAVRGTMGRDDVLHFLSATTGQGMETLIASIIGLAERAFNLEPALVTRERQRMRLQESQDSLDAASIQMRSGTGEELVAEHLRAALTNLGRLTGRVDVEEVLDVIFKDFCIGK